MTSKTGWLRRLRLVAIITMTLAASVWTSPSTRAAGAINIQPTRLQLTANSRFTSFTLTNPGDLPLVFQIQTQSWTQKGNRDIVTGTNDLIVAPPVLSIDAGASRVVRLALRDVRPGDRELTYRILITQVPDKTKFHGLRFIYQLNVPLYVAPVAGPEIKTRFSARLDGSGHLVRVTVQNSGTVHFIVEQLRLFGGFAANVPLGEVQVNSSVLAGASRTYAVPIKARPQTSSITVETSAMGQPPVRATVQLMP